MLPQKKQVLIVDDNPDRHVYYRHHYSDYDLTHAYDYISAVGALCGRPYDIIQLDFDLNDFSPDFYSIDGVLRTGYHVAEFLVELYQAFDIRQDAARNLPKPKILIQSVNPDGARSMTKLLQDHGFDVDWQMFHYPNDKHNDNGI